MLYEKALVLAKVESVFRTDAAPNAADNAMLVIDPKYVPNVTQLRRAIVKSDLSPLAAAVGRKVATISFGYEVRGNGNTVGTTPPQVGILLRGCGMSQTQLTGTSGTIGNAVLGLSNSGTASWAKTAAFTQTLPRTLTITVTTGGGSGVAVVSITAPAVGDLAAVNQTGVTITNAAAVTVTGTGVQLTPSAITSLVIGDSWTFALTPAGYQYAPVSDSFESLTLYVYYDGLLHKLVGARGTFSVDAPGGNYATYTFTFTGDYVAVTDAAMPASPTYETTKPQQVELANLKVNGVTSLAASKFSIDIANAVNIRDDINNNDAYAGAIISGREPSLSFDPETTLEATNPFWAQLVAGTEVAWEARVGTTKGNVTRFSCPNCQYSNIGYSNRNGTRNYELSMQMARNAGNDELVIHIG